MSVTQVRVIACNDGVSLVVESAREDLIRMSLQHLQTCSCVHAPHTSRLIHTRRQDTAPLWIKTHLRRENKKQIMFLPFVMIIRRDGSSSYSIMKQLLFGTSYFNVQEKNGRRKSASYGEKDSWTEFDLCWYDRRFIIALKSRVCMCVLELSPLHRKWKYSADDGWEGDGKERRGYYGKMV